MNRRKWIAGLLAVVLCAAASADIVYVDLSGIDTIVTNPPLTDAQKQALKDCILADINANFAAIGVDIQATDNPGLNSNRIVRLHPQTGSRPNGDGGTTYFYGEWAHGSTECDVYLGNFFNRHGGDYKTNGQWDVSKLCNGIGRTAAHEVAHSYSVGHNRHNPPDKMTEGGLVGSSTRANTGWIFDEHTGEVMGRNLGHPPCQTTTDYDGDFLEPYFWDAPLFPNPEYDPNDPNSDPFNDLDEWGDFDALLTIEGPMAELFDLGWYGADTDGGLEDGNPNFDFIYKASMAEPEPPELLTFFETAHASAQFLLRGRAGSGFDGQWFPMRDASVTLADPITTPAGDLIFRVVSMAWDVDGDQLADVGVTLNSDMLYPYGAAFNGWRLRHIYCIGDINFDSQIDLGDLAVLLANYNVAYGARYEDGDLDGDRDVDLADLATMLSVYGTDCPANEYCIPSGDDCYVTPCDGATLADFSQDPIPPDFFGPGSDPFDGEIPFGSDSGGEAPDTVIHRVGDVCLRPGDPAPAVVPIEIVQLHLVSCQTVVIMINGVPTEWEVGMTPGEITPVGEMRLLMPRLDGGVLSGTYQIQPVYTFTRTEPPFDTVVWDTGAMGIPPVEMVLAPDFDLPWSVDDILDPCTIDGFAPGVRIIDGLPCAVPACAHSVNTTSNQHCMRAAGYPDCP